MDGLVENSLIFILQWEYNCEVIPGQGNITPFFSLVSANLFILLPWPVIACPVLAIITLVLRVFFDYKKDTPTH